MPDSSFEYSYVTPPAAGPDPKSRAVANLISRGLSPDQAAGVVDRLQFESGGNPLAYNPAGGGQGARYLAQWRGPRQAALIQQYGGTPTQDQQLDFLWSELQGSERPALNAIKASKTRKDAYNAFTSLYERPGPTREAATSMGGGGAPGSVLDDLLAAHAAGGMQQAAPERAPPSFLDQMMNEAVSAAPATAPSAPSVPPPPPAAPSALDHLISQHAAAPPLAAAPVASPIASPPVPAARPPISVLDHLLAALPKTGRALVGGADVEPYQSPSSLFPDWGKMLHDTIQPLIGPEIPPELLAQVKADHPEMTDEEAHEVAQSQVNQGESRLDQLGRLSNVVLSGMAGPVPAGALGAGPSMGSRAADEFAGLDLSKMLRDAIQGGRLPKGSSIDDVKNLIRELRAQQGARKEPPPLNESLPVPSAGGGALGPPNPPIPPIRSGPPTEPEGGDPFSETAEPRDTTPGDDTESQAMRIQRLAAMHDTQDKLHELYTQAESDKLRFWKTFEKEPRLSPEEKLQVERYLEWQPGMPPVPAPSTAAQNVIDHVIKPSQRAAAQNLAYLAKEGVFDRQGEESLEAMTEGYLHRIKLNKPGEPHPFEPFAGVRSLRQKASSQHHRGYYVLHGPEDQRLLKMGRPPQPYGTKVPETRNPSRQWEVRRATTEEIERQTDTRYLHDPMFATLQNQMQLRIARRNVEMLKGDILPDLVRHGLAQTGDVRRLGFESSKVPVLRGWSFTPRLAHAFDDFYERPQIVNREFSEGMEELFHLGAINRWAIASMFMNPVPHGLNVTSDFGLSRGPLWASIPAYGQLAQHARAAFNDVWNKTDFYHDILKNGGALMGASSANRVAYNAFLMKARDEMSRLPIWDDLARQTGIFKTGKEWAEWSWNQSQRGMWGYHDLLLVTRVRELMADKKLGIATAVREAERFIANYQVPAVVQGAGKISLPTKAARALAILQQDHKVLAFGPYKYAKLHALANTVRDAGAAMSKSGMSMAQRREALGRLTYLLIVSTVAQFGINFLLQKVTGNPEARGRVPGAMGIPANAARVASDLFRRDWGEGVYDFWSGLFSIVTPAPALMEAASQILNYDIFSGAPISGSQLEIWKQLLQRGSHAAGELVSPFSEIKRIIQGRGVPSVGISLPDPAAIARAKRFQLRQRRPQERRFNKQFPALQ